MARYKPYTVEDVIRVNEAADACPDRGPVVDREPVAGCGCATHLCTSRVKIVGRYDCLQCKAAEMGVGVELPDENA